MNQSEDFGKILKPWPNLVDHFIANWQLDMDVVRQGSIQGG